MKPQQIAASAILFLAVSPSLPAAEIKMDFDGARLSAGRGSGVIAPAAPQSVKLTAVEPASGRWGDIPEPPDPTPVDGYPGNGGNDGGDYDDGGHSSPGHSSGGGYNPSDTFAATVCNNGQCSNITWQQTAEKASNYIVKKYVSGKYSYEPSIRFEFPPTMARPAILKHLLTLEKETIKIAETQIKNDIKGIQPMAWDTEADKERKEQVIKNDLKALKKWKKEALKEAKRGVNFTTMYPDNEWNPRNIWIFSPEQGGAYDRLSDALQGKEWYN